VSKAANHSRRYSQPIGKRISTFLTAVRYCRSQYYDFKNSFTDKKVEKNWRFAEEKLFVTLVFKKSDIFRRNWRKQQKIVTITLT
jgi:hypothetical protein